MQQQPRKLAKEIADLDFILAQLQTDIIPLNGPHSALPLERTDKKLVEEEDTGRSTKGKSAEIFKDSFGFNSISEPPTKTYRRPSIVTTKLAIPQQEKNLPTSLSASVLQEGSRIAISYDELAADLASPLKSADHLNMAPTPTLASSQEQNLIITRASVRRAPPPPPPLEISQKMTEATIPGPRSAQPPVPHPRAMISPPRRNKAVYTDIVIPSTRKSTRVPPPPPPEADTIVYDEDNLPELPGIIHAPKKFPVLEPRGNKRASIALHFERMDLDLPMPPNIIVEEPSPAEQAAQEEDEQDNMTAYSFEPQQRIELPDDDDDAVYEEDSDAEDEQLARRIVKPDVQQDAAAKKLDQDQLLNRLEQSSLRISMPRARKITARIYIDADGRFKTLVITSAMTARHIIHHMNSKGLLDPSPTWTLFEIVNDVGIERPLSDWEIPVDVMASWEENTSNALLVRQYAFKDSVGVKIIEQEFPKMFGWVYIQTIQGKWDRRQLELRSGDLIHYKDKEYKEGSEQLLCPLSTFEAYTLFQYPKKSPTKHILCMKSIDPPAIFERVSDYAHFIAVESQEKLTDWILSIRHAKISLMIERRSAAGLLQPQEEMDESESEEEQVISQVRPKGSVVKQSEIAPRAAIPLPTMTGGPPLPLLAPKPRAEDRDDDDTVPLALRSTLQRKPSGPLIQFTEAEYKYKMPKIKPSLASRGVGQCKSCGCLVFNANAFKKEQCTNCFHVH